MTKFTELLPSSKSSKNRAYTWEPIDSPDTPVAGVLTITDSRTHTRYLIEEFPCDMGRGFCLRKPVDAGGGYYCVNIRGFASDDCDCRGFQAHRTCKHSAALADLVNAGRI